MSKKHTNRDLFQGNRANCLEIQEGYDALYEMMDIIERAKMAPERKRESVSRINKIYKALMVANVQHREGEIIAMMFQEIKDRVRIVETTSLAMQKKASYRSADFANRLNEVSK